MDLLILDNYDSFTFNLVHLVEKVSDIDFEVKRNNEISLDQVSRYNKILLSPGPGLPSEAGIMPELLKHYHHEKSILGVCLGLQAIAECFGGKLKNLKQVVHGMASPVTITSDDIIFKNCQSPFMAGRYHSWVMDGDFIPVDMEVTARDEKGEIMAARHKTFDVRGVQFHPESILSQQGELIMGNWLQS